MCLSNLWFNKVVSAQERLRAYPMKKRLENHENATCIYEAEYLPMKGKKSWFLTKTGRGCPTKKAGK